jgi:hypothetical protein
MPARTSASHGGAVAPPAYRRLHRVFFALCLLLAPLCLAGWFTLCPQYGDPACPNNAQPLAAFAAFRAANPLLMQAFLGLSVIVPYLYPISYVALGMLAMKRSPWLSTLGIASGWLGSIAWGFIADAMFQFNAAIRLGQDSSYVVLVKTYFSDPRMLAVATGWVLGHLLAYVLLGIALLRARVIPPWAAYLIIISAPLMGPIAYGTHLGIFQDLGYVLVFIGSIPAALAILRLADDPAPLSAGAASKSAT